MNMPESLNNAHILVRMETGHIYHSLAPLSAVCFPFLELQACIYPTATPIYFHLPCLVELQSAYKIQYIRAASTCSTSAIFWLLWPKSLPPIGWMKSLCDLESSKLHPLVLIWILLAVRFL